MNNPDHSEWNEDEAKAFRELGQAEAKVPPGLKTQVVDGLRVAGLLSDSRRRGGFLPWAAAAAVALLAFGLGRASSLARSEPPPPGQRYVLLLSGAGSTSPEENQARRKEYGDWLKDLENRGLGVDGAELVNPRDLPDPRPGPPVVGYFIINAHDESEALAIARTTPHLRHGGGVTVAALR